MKQDRNLTADEKEHIVTELFAMSEARLVFTGEGFKATFNGAFLALEKDPKYGDLVMYNPYRDNHVFAVSGADLRRILKLDVDACTGIELVFPRKTLSISRYEAIDWLLKMLKYAGRESETEILQKYWSKLPERCRYESYDMQPV